MTTHATPSPKPFHMLASTAKLTGIPNCYKLLSTSSTSMFCSLYWSFPSRIPRRCWNMFLQPWDTHHI